MPNGIVPDESLAECLSSILNSAAALLIPWEALLFVNDFTPTGAVTLADLVEPSWASYTRRTLTPEQWSAPTTFDGYARSQWSLDPVEFPNAASAAETVYGYAIFDPGLNLLRHCERFDPDDIRLIEAGGSVRLVPRVSFRSQTPLE